MKCERHHPSSNPPTRLGRKRSSVYDAFLSGKLEDYALPEETLSGLLKKVDALPKP